MSQINDVKKTLSLRADHIEFLDRLKKKGMSNSDAVRRALDDYMKNNPLEASNGKRGKGN